jgi:hypothetical protein
MYITATITSDNRMLCGIHQAKQKPSMCHIICIVNVANMTIFASAYSLPVYLAVASPDSMPGQGQLLNI